MKTEALKKIIKEAVREAIQEELKEVLLENKNTIQKINQIKGFPIAGTANKKIIEKAIIAPIIDTNNLCHNFMISNTQPIKGS